MDCPVGSCFVVCIAIDRDELEHSAYYAEKAHIIVSDLKCAGLDAGWLRMSSKKYMVIQGQIDQLSHYSDIKMKSLSKCQFINAFFNKSGDFGIQFENISTWLTILWHEIIHASKKHHAIWSSIQSKPVVNVSFLENESMSGGILQHPEFKFLVCVCKLFLYFFAEAHNNLNNKSIELVACCL